MLIKIFLIMVALSIGSFLNLAIYRIPRKESLWQPGSHCPHCGHKLYPRDLLPVFSYLVLGGRCRYCKQDINRRYLVVELIIAVSYIMIYDKSGFSWESAIGWVFTALLVTCAFIDLEEGIIPDLITYPGLILGLGLSFHSIGFRSAITGLMLFAGLLILAALFSRGGMGGGDIKLAGVIGAFLGYRGAVSTFFISSLAGGLGAVILLLQGKAHRKTALRFGPYLAAAAWLVWMFGEEISDFYWRAFF